MVDKTLPHYSCIDILLVSPFVSFTSSNCALNDVSIVQKFGSWPEGDKGIGKRMPYLSTDGNLLLSTCDCKSGTTFGTVVSQAAEYHPAHWTSGDAENPGIIWYWIKESSTMLQGMVCIHEEFDLIRRCCSLYLGFATFLFSSCSQNLSMRLYNRSKVQNSILDYYSTRLGNF